MKNLFLFVFCFLMMGAGDRAFGADADWQDVQSQGSVTTQGSAVQQCDNQNGHAPNKACMIDPTGRPAVVKASEPNFAKANFSANMDIVMNPSHRVSKLFDPDERGFFGRVVISRENFLKLHGYDEEFSG